VALADWRLRWALRDLNYALLEGVAHLDQPSERAFCSVAVEEMTGCVGNAER